MSAPENGRYGVVNINLDGYRVHVCRDCGSVVFTTKVHDEWHDEQNETARKARRLTGMETYGA